jgi:meso-butanediol dehydrogenase/(S,S)-butanediol dehydrogenase/diacetyl reductase
MVNAMYDLSGKVAVVTGSGRHKGIGKAIVKRYAEEGAHVVVADLGEEKGEKFSEEHIGTTGEMEEIAEEIRSDTGAEVTTIPCDVRREEDVEALIQQTVDAFGRLDVLVNNAGVGYIMEQLVDLSFDDWNAVLEVNLRGPFLGTKHAARQMIDQGDGGRIINIASQAAKSAVPFAGAYVSSKHGLVGLTRTAALELGEHGITVNAVCPNHITTGLGHWQNEFFSDKMGQDYEDYLQDIRDRVPLGRVGRVEDIAKACAFLASDQAEYISGEAINVSGGEEMH